MKKKDSREWTIPKNSFLLLPENEKEVKQMIRRFKKRCSEKPTHTTVFDDFGNLIGFIAYKDLRKERIGDQCE